MSELRNCPFCGGDDTDIRHAGPSSHFAHCMNCGGSGPIADYPDFAASAWNTRTDPLLDEMAEALDGVVLVCGRSGNAFADFEEQAAAFNRETGVMRPGKDVAAAGGVSLENRREIYSGWVESKIEDARRILARYDAMKKERGDA